MLVILLLVSLFLRGSCLKLTLSQDTSDMPELSCIVNITQQYLSETKSLVYLDQVHGTNTLLKTLHSMEIVSFDRGNSDIVNPTFAYLIVFETVYEFLQANIIIQQSKEPNWNPCATFLLVFKTLRTEDLRPVFDVFLNYRVYNVVILNGTFTAELFTYNPYEDFACGRYYSRIISYGKCSDVTVNIYPSKAITGLRNCSFHVSVPHWPPWGIDPSKMNIGTSVMGTEQYIFHLLSEIEKFKYKFYFDYDPEEFSTVTQNLSITGPMTLLMRNYTDFMLGGLILIPSRAKVFSYISGHVDYIDEIKLMVQRANQIPPCNSIYLEFGTPVWVLIVFSLFIYSALVSILLKANDKGRVILILMDGFLSHAIRFRSRQSVKYVVIVWVVFAYLVNSFYTTTLMSLTASPPVDYQICDEHTVIKRHLEPCVSLVMGEYMKSEQNHGEILKDVKFGTKGCESLIDSVRTVQKSNHRFTIVLYSIYFFNKLQFYSHYERPMVYSFASPYTKVIYGMYYNKGMPMSDRLYNLAVRIRETGLSEKNLRDLYLNQTLYTAYKNRSHFRAPGFEAYFAIPWFLYAIGVFISVITFMTELASRYNKAQVEPKIN